MPVQADSAAANLDVVSWRHGTNILIGREVIYEAPGKVAGRVIVRQSQRDVLYPERIQIGGPCHFALRMMEIERPGAGMISCKVEALVVLGPQR